MFGKRPYRGRDRKEIRENMLMKQIKIKRDQVPDKWSIEAADFINRLIQRKPVNRLGSNGPDEVKSHVWFKNFDWDSLNKRTMKSPFVPPEGDNFDFKYANDKWKDEQSDEMKKQAELVRQSSVQALFNGYYYANVASMSNNGVVISTENESSSTKKLPERPSSKSTNSNSIVK